LSVLRDIVVTYTDTRSKISLSKRVRRFSSGVCPRENMSAIFRILITLGILFIIFYLYKKSKIKKEEERKARNEAERQAKEKMINPQKKLHEEEKKRWEDEYWKRQRDRE
jgi:predicted membrane protein